MSADLSAAAIGDLGIPARATWNWLGVTMYLQPETTAAALRAIAAGLAGTTLVVNFLLAPARSTRWDTPCATPLRRQPRPPGTYRGYLYAR